MCGVDSGKASLEDAPLLSLGPKEADYLTGGAFSRGTCSFGFS